MEANGLSQLVEGRASQAKAGRAASFTTAVTRRPGDNLRLLVEINGALRLAKRVIGE